jgi:hypothetical protein
MNHTKNPAARGFALDWLQCEGPGVPRAGIIKARVMVLEAMRVTGPAAYLRRTPKPGRAIDIGSSSGTNFASFSASSYST